MEPLEKQVHARLRVKEIKKFYTDLTLYIAVITGIVLIWAVSGGGYFWPIWVIVGWGIGIFLEALSLNMLPTLERMLPFLSRDWEEKQLQILLEKEFPFEVSSVPTVPSVPLPSKAKKL